MLLTGAVLLTGTAVGASTAGTGAAATGVRAAAAQPTASAASAFSNAPLWYVTRSTGLVAFLLLTVTMLLGLAATQRALASPRWPRFATQQLHRNVAVLAVLFTAVHIVTTLADRYVHVGWWSAVLPGLSPYRRPWVALGTLAVDLMVVVTVTSLVRDRVSLPLWRLVHLSSYLLWPLTVVHFWRTGTDAAHHRFGLYLDGVALLVVGLAALARLVTPNPERGRVRALPGAVR